MKDDNLKMAVQQIVLAGVFTAGILLVLPFARVATITDNQKIDTYSPEIVSILEPPQPPPELPKLEQVEPPPEEVVFEQQLESTFEPVSPERIIENLTLPVFQGAMDFSTSTHTGLSFEIAAGVSLEATSGVNTSASEFYGLEALDRKPRPISQTMPSYPLRARERNIQGHVEVTFIVDEKGDVVNPRITVSEPRGEFDASALRAVSSWKFEPGIKDNQRVPVLIKITLRFNIQ